MKKFFFFICCTALIAARAAMPGDTPGETRHKLQWLDCSPMPLGKLPSGKDSDIPDLRAVVFLLTRARNTPQTVAMLENLRRHYQGKLMIAVITPDYVSEAEELLAEHKDARLRFAVDIERRLTPEIMRDSAMLFPMAFLLDRNGMIIWRGEAVDLPEAVEKQLAGKLQLDTQKKTAILINKMHQYMRSGNMPDIIDSARKILDTDPGNPAALRMAVFAAESAGTPQKAWDIITAEIKKSPDLPRLYFTALDLAVRHREYQKELPGLIKNFSEKEFLPPVRFAFAGALLESFTYNADAVIGAKNIIAGTPMPLNAGAARMGQLLSVRARLHYALCDLNAAEADMSEAVECFKKTTDRASLAAAEKQLAYFRKLISHLDGEK